MTDPSATEDENIARLDLMLDQALAIAQGSVGSRPAVARHISLALQSLRDPHTSIRVENLSSANDG